MYIYVFNDLSFVFYNILVEVFTNHILPESTYFTNHTE